MILLEIFQGFLSVGACGGDLKSAALPVDQDLKTLENIRFVVNKHYFKHLPPLIEQL